MLARRLLHPVLAQQVQSGRDRGKRVIHGEPLGHRHHPDRVGSPAGARGSRVHALPYRVIVVADLPRPLPFGRPRARVGHVRRQRSRLSAGLARPATGAAAARPCCAAPPGRAAAAPWNEQKYRWNR